MKRKIQRNKIYKTPLSVSGVTVDTRSCDYTVASGFNAGDGSESSPYLICTYAQLDKMRDNLKAYYELGQDINANPSWSAGDQRMYGLRWKYGSRQQLLARGGFL